MPDLRMRRLLLLAGIVGLLFTCGGLAQIALAHSLTEWNTGRWLLFVAWLILMPLFVYVIGLRRRARRRARRQAEDRLHSLDAEAERLRTPEGIRALGGEPPTRE